jgi:PIN domain nuclease of toxin-antitoxin system
VSDRLLLDTHIALWLDSGDDRLLSATRALIDECWQGGGTICLSAVSAWEIALLVDGGRIDLDLPTAAWLERFLDRPGIEGVALSIDAAARSYELYHLEHRDPADRLLIATAIELRCPLVTYDEKIVRFWQRYGRRYQFEAADDGSTRPRWLQEE